MYFKTKKYTIVQALIRKRIYIRYGVLFGRGSKIDSSLHITHPTGIIIGGGSIIKEDVVIYQGVTLGLKNGNSYDEAKKNIENGYYPIIERGVKIYSNAVVIGGITIGENSVIGANSVVTKNVPPNTLVAGTPAKILKNIHNI
ncbi:MAG: hypothetical protein LKF42_03845 [Streptococcaceae bacterium]|nr:hypothetical protein [Streptococcaceae bacterium]MCH4176957.1 hypothetical protein [Streptococcaceae bacterium]